MATRELQNINNSGELTNHQLGSVASGDKLLTSDEIAASYTTIATTTALDVRVTANEGDITTNTAGIATNTADIVTLEATSLDHENRITVLEASHELLLVASSTASSQQPGTTDTPIQVEFGVAQTTTDISISAAGAITFNTAGKYIIAPFFQYGRSGSTGTSILLNRYLRNGTQEGGSLAAKIDSADTLVPWSSSIQFTAVVNDILTIEVMRDSSGNDSGGLFAFSPTLPGWNQAPCAGIQIYKAT